MEAERSSDTSVTTYCSIHDVISQKTGIFLNDNRLFAGACCRHAQRSPRYSEAASFSGRSVHIINTWGDIYQKP